MSGRKYSSLDSMIMRLDRTVSIPFKQEKKGTRENPAERLVDIPLSAQEKRLSAGLMRVNHAGEIAAQALYQGQGFTARQSYVKKSMQQAADEEIDHLNWCEDRISELGSHTSYLAPVWFLGSFTIGAITGAVGDKWSLGFVAETERQVVEHLESHLNYLPENDDKSRVILEQMKDDEARHATAAWEAGARELPPVIKRLMRMCSKVMTTTAYWV